MTEIISDMTFILVGYALGCFTAGYYLVRFTTAIDIRDTGSGSVGATNVGRLLGTKGFVLTLLADFLKGGAALLFAQLSNCQPPWLTLVVLAVVAGHIWPVQLKFKGGKGIATSLGALLVYDPVFTFTLLGMFAVLFVVKNDRVLKGLFVTACMPALAVLLNRPGFDVTTYFVLAVMLLWAHRDNFMKRCRQSNL